jgi:hypothetical protein
VLNQSKDDSGADQNDDGKLDEDEVAGSFPVWLRRLMANFVVKSNCKRQKQKDKD